MRKPAAFSATLEIIGINPFVRVPVKILQSIFTAAGKKKGPIPIKGTVNGKPITQTLVYYAGAWRLYVNMTMRSNSPKHVGEKVAITLSFDSDDRVIPMHAKLKAALELNPEALAVFEWQSPSLKNEMLRYIHRLKTDSAIDKTVSRALNFLLGKGRFVGRDKPKS